MSQPSSIVGVVCPRGAFEGSAAISDSLWGRSGLHVSGRRGRVVLLALYQQVLGPMEEVLPITWPA
jgi:hypothetical protein